MLKSKSLREFIACRSSSLLAVLLIAVFWAPIAIGETPCGVYDSGEPRSGGDPDPAPECGGPGIPGPSVVARGAGTGSLTTLFAGGNSFAGNTFDIEPQVALTITGFDVNLDPPGTLTTMAVYWRNGTAQGNQSDPAGWTLLGTDDVMPQGEGVPTSVDIGGLALTAGQTYGFYVDVQSYPSASIQYTDGGPTTFSNADLDLTTFHGKGDPAFTGSDFFPRQWNGTVYYSLGGGAPQVAVPTLGWAGLIVLLLTLAAIGLLTLRRRRSTTG